MIRQAKGISGCEKINTTGAPISATTSLADGEGRLWSFQSVGWDGVWIDSYSHIFRKGYWDMSPLLKLPEAAENMLDRIAKSVGSRSGAWDMFCWSGQDFMFAESNHGVSDKIRTSQRRWLDAAMGLGVSLRHFLLVEWRYKDSNRRGYELPPK